jgi:hypothetical protein
VKDQLRSSVKYLSTFELLDFFKQFERLLRVYRLRWIMFTVAGIVLGIVWATLSERIYIAECTFSVNQKSTPVVNLLTAEESMMNLSFTPSLYYSGDNVAELMTGRYLVEKALLTELENGDGRDLLINRYLEVTGRKQRLVASGVYFSASMSRASFSRSQDSLLGEIYQELKSNSLLAYRVHKKSAFFYFSVVTPDPSLSFSLLTAIVSGLESMYAQQRESANNAGTHVYASVFDSLDLVITGNLLKFASLEDQSIVPVKSVLKVSRDAIQENIRTLSSYYIEVGKRREISQVASQWYDPLLLMVDVPHFPLRLKKRGKLVTAVATTFFVQLGFILWIGFKARTVENTSTGSQ